MPGEATQLELREPDNRMYRSLERYQDHWPVRAGQVRSPDHTESAREFRTRHQALSMREMLQAAQNSGASYFIEQPSAGEPPIPLDGAQRGVFEVNLHGLGSFFDREPAKEAEFNYLRLPAGIWRSEERR